MGKIMPLAYLWGKRHAKLWPLLRTRPKILGVYRYETVQ
jgi:hypothetical protein